jgi:hypothetical protein
MIHFLNDDCFTKVAQYIDITTAEALMKCSKTLKLKVLLFSSAEDCLLEFAKTHPRELPFCLISDISLDQGSDGLLLIDILKDKHFEFVSIVLYCFALFLYCLVLCFYCLVLVSCTYLLLLSWVCQVCHSRCIVM